MLVRIKKHLQGKWQFIKEKGLARIAAKHQALDENAARLFESDTADFEAAKPPRMASKPLYVVALLLLIAYCWAYFSEMDTVVVAPGRIVTTRPLVVVQPIETSIIRSLDVVAGDVVRKGQPLATFEPTFTQADLMGNQEQGAALRAEVGRLQSEQQQKLYEGSAGEYEALQTDLAAARQKEYETHRAVLKAVITELQQQQLTVRNGQQGLAKQRDALERIAHIHEELEAHAAWPMVAALESRERASATRKQWQEQVDREQELHSKLNQATQELRNYEMTWRREVIEKLAGNVRTLRETDHASSKLKLREKLVTLRSPVDGMVLAVAKRSVGSVLREAEEFITIVPSDTRLDAEVSIASSDIAKVHVGDRVVIKFDAYPYTRFGTMAGTVHSISPDTVAPPDGTKPATFPTRIVLEHAQNAPIFRMQPGFTVTADVLVGKRTVLSYLTEPLKTTWKEALREP